MTVETVRHRNWTFTVFPSGVESWRWVAETLGDVEIRGENSWTDVRYPTKSAAIEGYKAHADRVEAMSQEIVHGFVCPINHPGCLKNCGSYGCGN